MHGHKIVNQNKLHYITLTIVGWIDVFTRDNYRKILIDSIAYCQNEKGLVINAYVIMSNHIHLICYTIEPNRLSDCIRDLKKFTAKGIIEPEICIRKSIPKLKCCKSEASPIYLL